MQISSLFHNTRPDGDLLPQEEAAFSLLEKLEIPYDRVNKGSGRKYQSEVYICRKDEAGRKLEKAAMLVCSKALGHNRISVVADNYIRGL